MENHDLALRGSQVFSMTRQEAEQEKLIAKWCKTKGLNAKTFAKLSIKTLHAIKIAHKLKTYKPETQFKAYIDNFLIKAPKGKTNGRDNMAIFRLHKYLKKHNREVTTLQ